VRLLVYLVVYLASRRAFGPVPARPLRCTQRQVRTARTRASRASSPQPWLRSVRADLATEPVAGDRIGLARPIRNGESGCRFRQRAVARIPVGFHPCRETWIAAAPIIRVRSAFPYPSDAGPSRRAGPYRALRQRVNVAMASQVLSQATIVRQHGVNPSEASPCRGCERTSQPLSHIPQARAVLPPSSLWRTIALPG